MNLDKNNIKKIRGLILFTVLIFVALWKYEIVLNILKGFIALITPFAIGGAIAFILSVPMNFVEKKLFTERKYAQKNWSLKLARPVSLILSLVFVIGIISLVVGVVVPQLVETLGSVGKTLQKAVPQIQEWLIKMCEDNPEIVAEIRNMKFDWKQIVENVGGFFSKGIEGVWNGTISAAKSIANGVSTLLIAIVFSIYILAQKEKLAVQAKKLLYAFVPRDWSEILIALGGLTHKTFTNFLTGQCIEALILGVMFFVVMSIIGLPYALLISVLVSFTALIPIFGAFIGCAIGALLILLVNPVQALIFVIVFLVLQQIEGNFIYPHVVGNSVGLPSVWVLVAVSVGASLMGVVGMLIFIPIVSVIYTLLRGIVNRRLKEKNIDV